MNKDTNNFNSYSKNILDELGPDQCLIQTFEELGELSQALAKKYRLTHNDKTLRGTEKNINDNLIEEIADVEICLANLKLLFNISEETVDKVKEYKIQRAKKMLNIATEEK